MVIIIFLFSPCADVCALVLAVVSAVKQTTAVVIQSDAILASRELMASNILLIVQPIAIIRGKVIILNDDKLFIIIGLFTMNVKHKGILRSILGI